MRDTIRWEFEYLRLMDMIMQQGHEEKNDRTGIGTKYLTGVGLKMAGLEDYFPAMTTKKLFFKPVVGELLWFLSGSSDVEDLAEITFGDRTKRTIWHDNVENPPKGWEHTNFGGGDAGRNYGVQWRRWSVADIFHSEYDQIWALIDGIKNNPTSRRHIVSAWNAAEIEQTVLPPCHVLFQCHVRADKRIDMTMYQRSADMFLGVPFNIASYATLLYLICRHSSADGTKYLPGDLTIMFGNAHIYLNHIDAVKEQLGNAIQEAPTLDIKWKDSLDEYTVQDFKLIDYNSAPAIRAPMAV